MSTTLSCIQWMTTQEGQNPCVTAQEVGQLCNKAYNVSLTSFQESSYVPNATTANGCTCSWSIYNLLSACTFCVGQSQYISWSTWITSCGSYVSNTSYLPSGFTVSQGIPFWAATNPSTWVNATFNVDQAANIAAEDKPDVTGEPLPTSTTTTSSSSVSVGMIVGVVIGGIAIIITGAVFILCAVYRRRRQRTHTSPTGVLSFNASQPVMMPSIRNRTPAQSTTFGYTHTSPTPISPYPTSPVHSTTSLAPTSLISPISSGFSSNGHNTFPVTDAADMISPFLLASSSHQTNRASTPLPTGKAAEALSERVMAPSGRRARLNPPPYSASAEPGSSVSAITWGRRLSTGKQKKRQSSVSGVTTHSAHSRTSTWEGTAAVPAGTQAEQDQHRAASPGTGTVKSVQGTVSACGAGSVDGGGGTVETTHNDGGRVDQRPPAI